MGSHQHLRSADRRKTRRSRRRTLNSAVFGWVASIALLAGAGPARAQSADTPATVRMVAQDVAPGTWFVQGLSALGSAANQNFISNAAFVITPDGVLVIDALGSPPLAERLLAMIRERTSLPLRYLVVTHCHADHIYGLQVFKAAGARIVAHAGCREYLNSDTARLRLQASREEMFPWVDERTQLVTPDQWLGDDPQDQDLVLSLGDRRFRVRHAGPAHTPEDLIVSTEDLPGWKVATDNGLTVALDVTMSETLLAEGIARDLVNRIQNLRKEKDFNVTDRISVRIERHPAIQSAVEQYGDYIKSEVLANSLSLAETVAGEQVELNDEVMLQMEVVVS